jgi:hypothetical protein
MTLTRVAMLLTALAAVAQGPTTERFTKALNVARPGEVRAVVRAGCGGCNWGAAGREAAALRVSVDGVYSQHVLLTRGDVPSHYEVTLGTLLPGTHQITIERDTQLSAAGAGAVSIDLSRTTVLVQGDGEDYLAQSMAPFLYARPNTVGKFTDVPILMWYEVAATPRGRRYEYSVIFTNEDGGTKTDRLMATWGRTTDIEFVYGIELDRDGRVVAEDFQGPGHEVPAFKGRHQGAHPLLWVSTDNNMVSESGATTVRYAPAPERYDLTNTAREAVMDRHPWSYVVAAQEMQREGKIVDDAQAGSGRIPDQRRFVFVEACTDLASGAALAFSVRASDGGAERWFDSDHGLADFRIVRDGCFRGAVALPRTAGPPEAVRFRAYSRPPQQRGPAVAVPRVVHVTRVNKMFRLGEDYLPAESRYSWVGLLEISVDGDWREPGR